MGISLNDAKLILNDQGGRHTVGQSNQKCKETSESNVRVMQNKTKIFLISVTHLILRFTIVQNKFQLTNKPYQ